MCVFTTVSYCNMQHNTKQLRQSSLSSNHYCTHAVYTLLQQNVLSQSIYQLVCSGVSREHSPAVTGSPAHNRDPTGPVRSEYTAACVPSANTQSHPAAQENSFQHRHLDQSCFTRELLPPTVEERSVMDKRHRL